MKVIHEKLLKEFSQPGRCEYCRKACPDGRDPAHIFSRGAGRVDTRKNLVSLCRECHSSSHSCGKPSRKELLAIAAKREQTTPEEIEAFIYRVRADDTTKVWRIS